MDLTKKRLTPVVAEQKSAKVISLRYNFCHQLPNILNEDLVYLDECGFNLNISPHYGYIRAKATPYIVASTKRRTNMSIIYAIRVDGIISYCIKIGSFNSSSLSEWCEDELKPLLEGRRCRIIMHNVSFHDVNMVVNKTSNDSQVVIFLSPKAHNSIPWRSSSDDQKRL